MASSPSFPDQSSCEGVLDFSLGPQSTVPHLHHQSSYEGIIEFEDDNETTRLGESQRANAEDKFTRIVNYFDTEEIRDTRPYSHSRLIRYTFKYARSERSKDKILKGFFNCLALSMDEDGEDSFEQVRPLFFCFADFLFDHLFLPLKASAAKTPQPSPAVAAAVQEAQGTRGTHTITATLDRVSDLRAKCLVRDRCRCVVSRRFHRAEMVSRIKNHGSNAQDDDGIAFQGSSTQYAFIEVAHILPHSLAATGPSGRLAPGEELAIKTLNMFDHGLKDLIAGPEIDMPRNAISLTQELHTLFGNFEIFFEPIFDPQSNSYQLNTYKIDSFEPYYEDLGIPVTRTLYLVENRTIEPPSPRLLALHSAIGHILHLSGAGGYINRLLDEEEEGGTEIRVDGSTDIGRLLSIGLWRMIKAY